MININLSPKGFVKDGLYDQKGALKEAGVRAAVCVAKSRDGKLVTTEDIRRDNTEANLIRRGLSTISLGHTTPTEQESVGLEIDGISRRLCLILNNEKEYAADERSLRYTAVLENEYNTSLEINLYYKWLEIFENIITKDYWDWFRKQTKTDNGARINITKKAQENARNFLGLATPTTLTYTVPFAQINKIAYLMEKVIQNPVDDFEKDCIPEMQEFIQALKDKKVLLTKNNIYEMIVNDSALEAEMAAKGKNIPYESFKGDDSLYYQDTKGLELSLFAKRNQWSNINNSNEVNLSSISYTNYQSLACLAQNQRHRTIALEMTASKENPKFTIPLFLKSYPALEAEYLADMAKVIDTYPLGMLVKVNMKANYANLFNYVAKERCCMMAQNEIAQMYTFEIIPYIYHQLLDYAYKTDNPLLRKQYLDKANQVSKYVEKYRCSFPDYHCPSPCRSIVLRREL